MRPTLLQRVRRPCSDIGVVIALAMRASSGVVREPEWTPISMMVERPTIWGLRPPATALIARSPPRLQGNRVTQVDDILVPRK